MSHNRRVFHALSTALQAMTTEPRRFLHLRRALILAAMAAAMVAIFALDTLTEYAVAAAVFHTAIILVAVRWFSPRLVIGITALCIALTLASFALTPAGAYRTGLINTGISILAIVITAYLGLKMVAAQNTAHAAQTQLLRITQATSLGRPRSPTKSTSRWRPSSPAAMPASAGWPSSRPILKKPARRWSASSAMPSGPAMSSRASAPWRVARRRASRNLTSTRPCARWCICRART